MSENDNQEKISEADVSSEMNESTNNKSKMSLKLYVVAVTVVAIVILGVLFQLEKEGRSNTNFFTTIIANQEASKTVAVVNEVEIINADLDTSIEQFSQMAVAQGVDITSPETMEEIRTQSLEVLINTELLKQDAAERGLSISDEAVDARLEEIKADMGGEEALNSRIESLGIGYEKLASDINDELLIQSLLEEIFAEAEIEITEEEISAVYEEASGLDDSLPSLEEVSAQIEAQLRTSKEQAAIDDYITVIREGAEIEIIE